MGVSLVFIVALIGVAVAVAVVLLAMALGSRQRDQ
jgi:hypothetical protein